MCGIAGYILEEGGRKDEATIRRMCSLLAHRGPDGEGIALDGRVALGHRRLSIIDVEGGRQPLGNEDGRLQIVFNGEIYNYQELMAGLKKRGHRFQTRSDTEAIVHLYEEVGERVPEYLNGMFAFAIWDRDKQEVFLARDRFGEKPLYYTQSIPGMDFCFGSELKALMAVDGFPRNIRAESVADFLNLSYVPDPDTIYRDVWKLEPSHRLLFGLKGGLRKSRYWCPSFEEQGMGSAAESAARIDGLARDAVRSRMVSDVPLGGFLSGGVDSSAVVAYMAQSAPDRVKTFSIGFTAKEYDELEYAQLVAQRYQTSHHEEVVTPRVEEMLGTLVRHYDEPFGDSSAIPTLYLARMTRKHVTVALSGDGADELFGGYRRYAFALTEERVRNLMPAWIRRSVVRGAARLYPKFDYLPRAFRAKSTLTGISQSLREAYFEAMSRFGSGGLNTLMSGDLEADWADEGSRERFCGRFTAFANLPPLAQLQAVDWQTYLPGDILVKVDRATMAYSLESRAPWLDHRLAELAARLPTREKVQGHEGKVLFKRAVSAHVPEQLLRRGKMGFAVPMPLWLRSSLKDTFERLVFQQEMERYLNLRAVRELWDRHQRRQRDYSAALWNILMLACWDQVHQRRAGWSPE